MLLAGRPLPRPLQTRPAGAQWHALLGRLLPRRVHPYLEAGSAHYLLLMAGIVPVLALILGVLYPTNAWRWARPCPGRGCDALRDGFIKTFAGLLLLSGVIAWWMVLTAGAAGCARRNPTARPSC